MEMEELTKSQIVLLVLLVSFVTSIATGIVTVSLLAQAPPAVTQTVNRIIERTIETVVPAEGQSAAVITKETTVVVKEDDLITQSISDSFGKIVRIHEGVSTSTPIIALGAVIGNGTIITDLAFVSDEHAVAVNNEMYLYIVSATIPDIGIAVLTATGTTPSVSSFTTIESDSLKLGQTLIGLYGARSDRVALSIFAGQSDLVQVGEEENVTSVRSLETTLTSKLTPGTPLITIFGELVGISTLVSRGDDRGNFVSYSDVVSILSKASEDSSTSEE